jgi:hypothetical protein
MTGDSESTEVKVGIFVRIEAGPRHEDAVEA